MKSPLKGAQQGTYDAVFQYPISRNLRWRDVRSLLSAVAEVVEEQNGNLKVSQSGHTLILHPSQHKEVATKMEVMEVRYFLERVSESSQATPADSQEGAALVKASGGVADSKHLLVVIDHRQARVYKTELRGSVPQRLTPCDPGCFGRHLHYVQDDSNGQRRPERKSFYEPVAKTLKGAEKILLFGSGTGASSAMEQLLIELKYRHPAVARRIVASIVVDAQHMSDDQLLAQAREFYAKTAS